MDGQGQKPHKRIHTKSEYCHGTLHLGCAPSLSDNCTVYPTHNTYLKLRPSLHGSSGPIVTRLFCKTLKHFISLIKSYIQRKRVSALLYSNLVISLWITQLHRPTCPLIHILQMGPWGEKAELGTLLGTSYVSNKCFID